jgi:hypothetical protein
MPGGGISFVSRGKTEDGQKPPLTIKELNPATRQVAPLVDVPPGAADVDTAWTPDGLLLVTVQGQLYSWRKGEAALRPAADLAAQGLRSATRLAISPRGDRIAIVAANQ